MIFLDASAVIAIIQKEDDAATLLASTEADPDRIVSAMSRWETIAGLVRSYRYLPEEAAVRVDDFLTTVGARLVPIDQREGMLASEAFARYGRGRHPAALNMGDCFTYACAKSSGARLIYKGADFAKTDLA